MCEESDCDLPVFCKRLCKLHYNRGRRAVKYSKETELQRTDRLAEGRRNSFAWYHGLTHEQADQALATKPTACSICTRDGRPLRYDHCHATGRHRGWICDNCNLVLGHAHDDPTVLRRAADYLEVES